MNFFILPEGSLSLKSEANKRALYKLTILPDFEKFFLSETSSELGLLKDLLISTPDSMMIFLIEDAAEAVGSFLDNQHAGTFGDFGIVSFKFTI